MNIMTAAAAAARQLELLFGLHFRLAVSRDDYDWHAARLRPLPPPPPPLCSPAPPSPPRP